MEMHGCKKKLHGICVLGKGEKVTLFGGCFLFFVEVGGADAAGQGEGRIVLEKKTSISFCLSSLSGLKLMKE